MTLKNQFPTFLFSGVKYINDCPVKRSVPIYLLVGGCCGILRVLATMWRNFQYRRQLDAYNDSYVHEGLYVSQTYRLMDVTLSLFLIGWLVAGSHWVFSVWEPPYSQPLHEPSNWCDKTVYRFAVYQIIGSYGFLSIVFIVSCLLTLYYKACSWISPICHSLNLIKLIQSNAIVLIFCDSYHDNNVLENIESIECFILHCIKQQISEWWLYLHIIPSVYETPPKVTSPPPLHVK